MTIFPYQTAPRNLLIATFGDVMLYYIIDYSAGSTNINFFPGALNGEWDGIWEFPSSSQR